MGEKIRDVQCIHLANKELMVELNEGYTKEQGKVIHIQNPVFRYLLNEDEYILAASLIMRGAVELQYIKSQQMSSKLCDPGNTNEDNLDFSLIKVIQDKSINYRILEKRDKVLTIIIDSNSFLRFKKDVIPSIDQILWHPQGEKYGYTFLYQMHPFEMYRDKGYYYEVFYEMPCLSLTPKTWMPLDKIVQRSLWDYWREEDGFFYASDEDTYIYFLTRCLFYYRQFHEKYTAFFVSHPNILESKTFINKLHKIVFNYTERLVEILKNRDYENIIKDYYSFTNY